MLKETDIFKQIKFYRSLKTKIEKTIQWINLEKKIKAAFYETLDRSNFIAYSGRFIGESITIREYIGAEDSTWIRITLFEKLKIRINISSLYLWNSFIVDEDDLDYIAKIATSYGDLRKLLRRYQEFLTYFLLKLGEYPNIESIQDKFSILKVTIRYIEEREHIAKACLDLDPDLFFTYDTKDEILMYLPSYECYVSTIRYATKTFEDRPPYSFQKFGGFAYQNKGFVRVDINTLKDKELNDLQRHLETTSLNYLLTDRDLSWVIEDSYEFTDYKLPKSDFKIDKELVTSTLLKRKVVSGKSVYRLKDGSYLLIDKEEKTLHKTDSAKEMNKLWKN